MSNNALMVVECDGAIAPERVRQALDRFVDVCPWPAARLRRAFPWGKLHWASGPRARLLPPSVSCRSVASPAELQDTLESELNAAIDPRRESPMRILIIDGSPGQGAIHSALTLTWFHPLMDPRGAQNVLTHLTHIDRVGGNAPGKDALPAFVSASDPRSLRERGRLARRGREHIRALGSVPPVSPGSSLTSPGRARFRKESFAERDPAGDGARTRRELSWRLAVVGKAMAELWERRGLPDDPFFLPIAVDLRGKGEAGPSFGNLLAFHFVRFRPSDTGDVAGVARALREQMVHALREGKIEASAVAMEFLAYRPISRMLRELPGTARRETFSFNCADVADFPLSCLFGRRVLNAYHVPAVLPRPGIGVFFNRCATRNNVVTSWVEGAVSEPEAVRIVEAVGKEMGWIRIP